MGVGGRGTFTKCQQNYTLKRTKLHHLKGRSRECMPPEHLTNAETISNIYSKRTILKEFSGEHAPIPLISAQQYLNYIHGRSGVVGRECMGTVFPQEQFREISNYYCY